MDEAHGAPGPPGAPPAPLSAVALAPELVGQGLGFSQ